MADTPQDGLVVHPPIDFRQVFPREGIVERAARELAKETSLFGPNTVLLDSLQGFSSGLAGLGSGIFGEPFVPLYFEFKIRDGAGGLLTYEDTNIPLALTFTVNPSNFDRTYKKTVSREQTRGGWVEYFGGDELDTISVNGVTEAFRTLAPGLSNIVHGRVNSAGWKELNALLSLFRSNGSQFDREGLIWKTHYVELTYDKGIYKGVFDSLSITESVDKPYSMDYNFNFIVEYTFFEFTGAIAANNVEFSQARSNK